MTDNKLFIDGQDYKQLVQAGLAWLQTHQNTVNALNVFPVPDGDTGTNMVLTMRSAWSEVADSTDQHIGRVSKQIAHGALMGARGNSGVILSQIWRGIAHGLDSKEACTAADLAAAMREGAQTAYKGVIRPVEGTILTVVREVADEALHATQESGDIQHLIERTVHRGRDAVARTPQMLSVLAEAGVVDAGGQGFYYILEGMLRYLKGDQSIEELHVEAIAPAFELAHVHGEDEYGYDVQFIIAGSGLDVDTIRSQIDAMGDSALIVGDSNAVKVHVHVPDPGVPISYAVQFGSLRDVVVEDMQAQAREFTARQAGPVLPATEREEPTIGLVAVSAGDGLARVFESLGVNAIIRGGQTMNPSTEEILQAIERVPCDQVIVLPNNKNILLAANQARDLSDKQVAVVPTRTIPQGIAAILAVNYQIDLETNVDLMTRATQEVYTGEVTVATRDVRLGGVDVNQGQYIGLLDDELVEANAAPEQVVHGLLERMHPSDLEIVTLYYGVDVTPEDADTLAEQLEDDYPNLEFEILEGGQPHYLYIISAE